MSSVTDVLNATTATSTTSKSSQSLSTDDFLQIMITELTNQDPFEPMDNSELINQMNGIQNIQSTQNLTENLTSMTDKFDSLLTQMDTFLTSQQDTVSTLTSVMGQQKLTMASQLIGQTISGKTDAGTEVSGVVSSVSISGDNIYLNLDSGEQINLTNMSKMEPTSSDSVTIGTVMKGTVNGHTLVGTVQSISVTGDKVMVNLKTKAEQEDGTIAESIVQVPLSDTEALNVSTVGDLIGKYVEGFVSDGTESGQQHITGIVNSYDITEDGINLILDSGETMTLTDLTGISSSATA